ncbi:MAG TPA: hypothetical protein DCO79_02790 [Spirochaeta sp.]|nr:hypothetical protein [Spirochaeta sp.]
MNLETFLINDLNLFGIFLMVALIAAVLSKESELSNSTVFFLVLCAATIINLAFEIIGWYFNGKPGEAGYYGIWISKFIFLFFNPIPTIAWLCYIDYLLFGSIDRLKKRWFYLYGLIACGLLMIVSIPFDFVYSIDAFNIYSRGPGIYVIMIINYAIMFYGLRLALKFRNTTQRMTFSAIALFVLLPGIGSVSQMLVYGITTIWILTSLGVLITYLFVEAQKETKDYLTGLLTRQQIDEYIQTRIRKVPSKGKFALIMIDMDGFKQINDKWGHNAGDQALVSMSYLLSRTVKRTDKVARFGGDEFLLVLESDSEAVTRAVVERLQQLVDFENKMSLKPYRIEFSFGYAVFDPEKYSGYKAFFQVADMMMYEAKAVKVEI